MVGVGSVAENQNPDVICTLTIATSLSAEEVSYVSDVIGDCLDVVEKILTYTRKQRRT
jgi:hypothetical protein